MRTKIFITVIAFLMVYIYFTYNPVIIRKTETRSSENKNFVVKNNHIKILTNLSFDSNDKFKAVLIINERENVSDELPFGHVFRCSEKKIIKELNEIDFIYTGADIATVENELIIYRNDEVIFRSGIIIDKNAEGLQNSDFGWVTTKNGDLTKVLDKFDRNFAPVVVIH